MALNPTWVQKALGIGLVLSVFWTSSALAHAEHGTEGGTPTVVTTLQKSIQLRVAKAAAYQFALSTNGKHNILVYGEDEKRPFLRLQGKTVQVDVHSAGWHRAQQPGGGAIPPALKENPNMTPNWVTLDESAAIGWYDPRLQQEDLASFNLKVNIDGKARTIEVARIETPDIQGFWRPEISSELEHPAFSAMVPGLSGNALMLIRTGQGAIAVLDDQGQAFLRLDSEGVWVNHKHPWSGDLGLFYAPEPNEDWVRVSTGTAVTYRDPRLKKTPKNRKQVSTWQVPLVILEGQSTLEIKGITRWQSLK
ncbi:MAG TPA: hypothetical protein VFV43_07940 [Limnobacter sp.]|nr:hypothetical protein [Limnobacter sp.]